MITSRRTFELLTVTVFLAVGMYFPPATAADNQRQPEERISIDHARVARSPQSAPARKQKSLVAQAAQGRVLADAPETPLDGSLVKNGLRGGVQQAGFVDGSGCGPVCDCGSCCDVDPGCGIEPGCGVEVGCGLEPGCGFEVGCGLEAAYDSVSGAIGPGCGVEGCLECGEASCGIEEFYSEPACGMETIGDCSCDACCVDSVPVFLPLLRINWCRFEFFAGVQGFKGPLSYANTSTTNQNARSGSGSFGFYEGFNEGRSLRRWLGCDMASQFGLRATQSNLYGDEFTNETRHQIFLTGGLFRRVDYGLQYGVVLDYLNEDWYFQGNSLQLRSELSWISGNCHVFGGQFMFGVNDQTSSTASRDVAGNLITTQIGFEPTDQYRVFYRRLLHGSGAWEAFGGLTSDDDGLLGASLNIPLRRNLVLSTGTTFLVPNQDITANDNEQEGWNISLGLIYRPGGPNGFGRYCRPMFDVADNGTFMLNRR
jgi:hypothetical protein